jgi:tetratricopeptide (TPR) repeat protein
VTSFDDYFALRKKGAYQAAYDVLRDIMEKQPRWSSVGDLHVWCAEFELLVNGDVRKAGEFLDRANELGCWRMAYYYSVRGYVLWRSGDHDGGRQYLERSVELDPTITNVAMMGKLLSSDQDERAIWIWQRVLAMDPDNCSAHIYLGIEAAESGDRGKALLMAKRAERLHPSVRDVAEIGGLYRRLGEFQIALDKYLDANRLGYTPKGRLYASIAVCYFSLGEEDTARQYAEWAIRSSPEDDYVKDTWEKCQGD